MDRQWLLDPERSRRLQYLIGFAVGRYEAELVSQSKCPTCGQDWPESNPDPDEETE